MTSKIDREHGLILPPPQTVQAIPAHRYPQIQNRLDQLLNHYFAPDRLTDRLADLPQQFHAPAPRPWQPIHWPDITCEQIQGMATDTFLAILQGAIDTEAPIRGYTQTSRQYLQPFHPAMAKFVGGVVATDGTVIEPGLWEKEERQHSPALSKLYQQLSQQKVLVKPHAVRPYQPCADPLDALYRHGLHRIATEYGAACLYLWLMLHSTGSLHAVLAELLVDEINHMVKFWGFGRWLYPNSSLGRMGWTVLRTMHGHVTYRRDRSSLVGTLHRMTTVLGWSTWSIHNRLSFTHTCLQVLHRLTAWNRSITNAYLQTLFGRSPHP